MKIRTRGLLAGLLTAGLMAASAPAMASAVDDADASHLTEVEQSTLADIFGYEPSEAETEQYLDLYGSVPTEAEVAAYLAADGEAAAYEHGEIAARSLGGGIGLRAATFQTYFKAGQWITRDGVVSLSLMPRDGGIGNESREGTWTMVKNVFSSSPKWKNTAMMTEQYNCHFKYGMLKTPWNLEPHRTSINHVTCN
ncbi:MAG: DUF2599 domain-containing protein [Microbacterium arborescens]